jgi:aminoglycoside phosphotransferase (APT) family kinase protein
VVLRRWPGEDWAEGLVTRVASALATTQAAIHAVADHPQTRWDGWYDDGAPLDWMTDHGLRDTAREAASGPLVEEKVLVRSDYRHFNVRCRDTRLSGVVDWPNAATGNRGSDVGHCRLNLAVLFDTRTAGDYLVMYERAAGVRVDRRADLRALLCFDLGWQRFIPRQVAGRAPLELAGMPDRVAAAIRGALDGIG